MAHVRRFVRMLCAVSCLLGLTSPAAAQETASAGPARELARLMAERRLEAFAAPLGGDWVAALYLAGSELVVVKGSAVPAGRLEGLASRGAYRQAYIAINSTADPATKLLVSDVSADGLRAARQGSAPADTAESGARSHVFDGEWTRAGLTESEYGRIFSTVDQQYAQMLQALLAGLRGAP